MTEDKRIIKFRGIDNSNGIWVVGSLIKAADGCFIFSEGISALFQEPEYHESGMGCGLEDRGITDRYEAMQHGFDRAVEKCAELYPALIEVRPDTVGQFTGLQDKNRKEIYEGDIVKRTNEKYGDFVAPVVFMGGAFTIDVFKSNMKRTNGDFIHWKQDSEQQGGVSIGAGIYWRMEEIEIIGNIYQRPELLRV